MATTEELREALQRMINGRWASIPVEPGDADVMLSDAIDELGRLRAVVEAIHANGQKYRNAGVSKQWFVVRTMRMVAAALDGR